MIDNLLLDNLKMYLKAKKSALEFGEEIISENGEILGYKYLKKVGNQGSFEWLKYNDKFEKIIHNRSVKNNRIQKHIVYGLANYKFAWFGTFTFNDEFLSKSDRTQRDAIKKALKRLKIDYILNVDFGDLNERKHFHCILFLNLDLKEYTIYKPVKSKGTTKWLWCDLLGYNAGFCSFEPIGNTKEDVSALKKYINKLSNHCIKDSTENSRIVYSYKAYEFDYFKLDFGYVVTPRMSKRDFKFYKHYNLVHNGARYLADKEKLGFELI